MNDVFYPAAAAVAWAALVYRLVRGLRRDPGDPALYAICAAFGLMGLIFTVSTPVVWGALDAAAGVPNLSLLVSQGGVVAFSATIQCLIIFWTHPRREGWRRARWRVAGVAGALVLMAVLFARTAEREESRHTAAATYAHDPMYAVYLAVYIAVVTVGVVDIIRLCLAYAGRTGGSWLSRGLRTTAAGSALGLVYCGLRTGTLVAAQLDRDPYTWEFLVPPVSALGAMLIVIGLTLPALGPWLSQLRAHRTLRPLWEAVRVTTPEVVLGPGSARGADHRLHRRIIEIGDGLRAVRDHLGEQPGRVALAAARHAGLEGDNLRAVVYAARLRVAFAEHERERRAHGGEPDAGEAARRRRWDSWHDAQPTAAQPTAAQPTAAQPTGTPPTGTPLTLPPSGDPLPEREPSHDLAAEARWLSAVAAALSRSPVVADVAATCATERTDRV
ncbi:MAB_1171c family putative transporter [Actinoplanes sp. NPDC051494]|uniref:MAB_1171c family putative transporter n=1 Tax=Actinoplanes sp. NPDC051494 TaxID=3363907 RepID=UPI0037A194DE